MGNYVDTLPLEVVHARMLASGMTHYSYAEVVETFQAAQPVFAAFNAVMEKAAAVVSQYREGHWYTFQYDGTPENAPIFKFFNTYMTLCNKLFYLQSKKGAKEIYPVASWQQTITSCQSATKRMQKLLDKGV